MLRSMYAGISGMKNFQTKLDVIGNNIANVSTQGFKKGRVTFQEMMSQTTAGAQGPTGTRGGVNASQVGLGSQMGTIDNIHTQGFRQTTNNPLDMMIQGDGMFMVRENDGTIYYSRAGNFYLDNSGNIVNPQGLYLNGYRSESTIASTDFSIEDNDGNNLILSNRPNSNIYTITKSDQFGVEREIGEFDFDDIESLQPQFQFSNMVDDDGDVDGRAYMDIEGTNMSINLEYSGDETDGFELVNIHVLNNNINYTVDENLETVVYSTNIDDVEYRLTQDAEGFSLSIGDGSIAFEQDEDNPNIYTALIDEVEYRIEIEDSTITLLSGEDQEEVFSTEIVQPQPVISDQINYTNIGMLNIPETAQSFNIQTDGTIVYIDQFGEPRIAGQVAIASFSNPAGLTKEGNNLYLNSQNAGFNGLVPPGTQGAGSVVSNSLEMSNVDLAEEFTEMITAQRGFQANTRIITTSDEILQELVNLKR